MGSSYAVIGNFDFKQSDKGLSVYCYDEEKGRLYDGRTMFADVSVGQMICDSERSIIYFVDERKDLRGKIGGGGNLLAASFNSEDNSLSLLSENRTFAVQPCSVCTDMEKRYLLVAHHGSDSYVTKIRKDGEEKYTAITSFDDSPLLLFNLHKDGSIGSVCDIAYTSIDGEPGIQRPSHLHSVTCSPDGSLFLVTETGLGRILMYDIDRKNSTLVLRSETTLPSGQGPRYGLFHPILPILYCNDEDIPVMHAYRYTPEGALTWLGDTPLVAEDTPSVHAADVIINPDGTRVYTSLRDIDRIVVCDVDETGKLSVVQRIDCGGKNPRGLTLSPDGRYLFCLNKESRSVTTFSIDQQGLLTATGTELSQPCPGVMRFMTIE